MKSKKAEVSGSAVVTIYRVIIISLIAFMTLGVSAVFYSQYIDIMDAEAVLMGKQITKCLAPRGAIEISKIDELKENDLLSSCDIKGANLERFFVRATINLVDAGVLRELYHGDKGTLWIQKALGEKVSKYNPGYFETVIPTYILGTNTNSEGTLKIEVLIKNEK